MLLDGHSLLRRGPIILVLNKNPLSMLRAEDVVGEQGEPRVIFKYGKDSWRSLAEPDCGRQSESLPKKDICHIWERN